MKTIIGKSAAIAALVISGAANADYYWGVGYSTYEVDVDVEGGSISADVNGIEGSFGAVLNPYFAVEGRLGVGLSDENVKFNVGGTSVTSNIKYEVDRYLSIYVRPQIVKSNFQLYALLGYSDIEGELNGDGDNLSTDDNGISYGVGAGFIFSERNAINIEWKNLGEIDDGDITGITLSYQRRF